MKTIQLLKGAMLTVIASTLLFSCSKDDNGGVPPPPKDSEIVYETDFKKDDDMWYIGKDAKYIDGHYEIYGGEYTNNSYFTNLFSDGDINPTLEAVIKVKPNDEENWGGGGILFNHKSSGDTYSYIVFEISHDGYANVSGYNSTTKEWTAFIEWQVNSNVRKGDFNTLRIVYESDKIRFSINSKEVFTLPAVTGIDFKGSGLFVDAHSDLIATHFRASKKIK